jgi:soluble lytic murein transglycosylase-like protein
MGDVERTLAAYNAGIGRLKGDKWKLIRETRAYVPAVLEAAEAYRKLIASSAPTTEPVKSVEDTPKDWRTNRLRG